MGVYSQENEKKSSGLRKISEICRGLFQNKRVTFGNVNALEQDMSISDYSQHFVQI